MIRAWLRYFVFVVFCLSLYVFYVGYISYFLFIFVLSLPVLSYLLFRISLWRFEIQLHSSSTRIKCATTQEILLRSHTKVWVPLAKVEANLQLYNHFHHTSCKETLSFTSECDFSDVAMPFEFTACGKYTITIDSLYAYDILHLFKKKRKTDASLVLYVLPNPTRIQEELFYTPQPGEEEYDKQRAGNDPGETFDVHEYREGDSLHKMHWKLSAKLDTLMIRETSMLVSKGVKLCFDLYGKKMDADEILAQLYGCSEQLIQAHQTHEILQYEDGQCVRQETIASTTQLLAFLCERLSQSPVMSASSSLQNIEMQSDMIFIQKKQIVTYASKERGGQYETSK